ncbi:MAG: citramalate synthase [Candidatus Omnitrophica bacterium CG11_big_fil_rev_8_21_14_0_20_64_10]|nr:MAG: citramalate synthase [Candidatus Omnitrophica bacterium CG11_big_fil_rev_8_21_14_0_20_64_10]
MSGKVVIYDTTLRDGAQTLGISLSVTDKLRIAERLNALKVDYIEGGWPGANPRETDFFRQVRKLKSKHSVVTAFGSTRRANQRALKDPLIQGLIRAETQVVTIFGKTWDLHVKEALRVAPEENLRMIEDSVKTLRRAGRRVFYDAEHFFDGFRSNPDYALQTIRTAAEAGAEVVILCDTNGGSLPGFIRQAIAELRNAFPDLALGIHCHNDMELAVANSVAAVEAGAVQVQGTVNGYGERCGNANLVSIVPILQLKMGFHCLPAESLKQLKEASHYVAEVCNMRPEENQPFVGNAAFAHKGGVHINAVLKNPKTYEHIAPEVVGNQRKLLVSEMGGKSTILSRAKALNMDLGADPSEAKKFLKTVQDLEARGYHYEAAGASFELLMRRSYKRFKRFFTLEGFRVVIEKRADGAVESEATIQLQVDGESEHTASRGDGPVNALDQALRKALAGFYPKLKGMHLVDFKVRDLESQSGTAARVRVLIQSQDEKESWWTMGVSHNIIEASWLALVDSIEYKLLKEDKSRKK